MPRRKIPWRQIKLGYAWALVLERTQYHSLLYAGGDGEKLLVTVPSLQLAVGLCYAERAQRTCRHVVKVPSDGAHKLCRRWRTARSEGHFLSCL